METYFTLLFQIKREIEIGDFLTILSILIGVVVTIYQFKRESAKKRGEFLVNLHNSIIDDDKIMNMIYEIDYKKFKFDDDFHRSENEMVLDRLLNKLETISKIYELGNISDKELEIFAYEFLSVYRNEEVKSYLKFLENAYDKFETIPKFESFQRVGLHLEKMKSKRAIA